MTACARARPSGRRHATTIPKPSRTRSATGARPAATARLGSRSRASTAWMATARRCPSSSPSPTATTACSSSTRRTRPAYSAPTGAASAPSSRAARTCVTLHTCGKALGVTGALVLAPTTLRDYLVNRCRPFIYATAPSPLDAGAGARGSPHLPLRCRAARAAARAHCRWPASSSRPRAASPRRDRRSSRSSSARMRARRSSPPPCRRMASTSAPCARPRCPRAPRGCGCR